MNTPKKRAGLATVTSTPLLPDGLRVTVLTDRDRGAVKQKTAPTRRKSKP